MYYFKIHVGDYAKKTGHLSPLEHGIYLLILHAYYDRELGPTLLEATRWARARTEEEKHAVLGILDEFFVFDGERYSQARVEEELASYRGRVEVNRKIAIERENKKKARNEHESCTNGSPQEHESSTTKQPNHKPLTTNQEPKEKVKTTVEPTGPTVEVFSYWQLKHNHPQAKLDAKRLKAIKARLSDGYTVGELCEAIDGCGLSPHHMGQNETRTVYDDIELICRDGPRVDKFIKLARQGGAQGELQAFMEDMQQWAATK
jgi:uncharacterized protein YdaU (DUF1376 family)